MILLLDPDLSSYSDAAYESDLKLLPAQRYEKAMRYRFLPDRKRCVRAYMLLWKGLREEYGQNEAPVFDFGPNEKPVLRFSPEIHFSLSHTGNAVLCALDHRPVGADIEMIRSQDLRHLLSVFNEQEQEEIMQAEQPKLRFTELWTRKESYLKLTGQGLVGTRSFQTVPTRDTDAVHFETVLREESGFLYSVCQWQSPES